MPTPTLTRDVTAGCVPAAARTPLLLATGAAIVVAAYLLALVS